MGFVAMTTETHIDQQYFHFKYNVYTTYKEDYIEIYWATKETPAYIFLSYLKLKYQKIYCWLNMNASMCNHRIVFIIYGFAIPLALNIMSKVCTPEFESHRVYWYFSQKSLDDDSQGA